MVKVLCLIPLWGRSDIFELVAKSLCIQTKGLKGLDVQVLCVLSREDRQYTKLQMICKRHGFKYCVASNDYLGAKMNAGIAASLELDYDYLMNFGSDDLIHAKTFSIYKPYADRGVLMFGLRGIYFINTKTQKTLYYYYKQPFAVGAGRMIHKNVVTAITDAGLTLYTNEFQHGLDANSAHLIEKYSGVRCTVINNDTFPYLVDLKSDVNINSFEKLKTHCNITRPVDYFSTVNHYEDIRF